MRINKYLATSGIASRRASEKIIESGRVKINGKVVTDLATDVKLDNDTVMVDNKQVKPVVNFTYVMLNKPKGCVTTVSDDLGRKTIFDYIEDTNKRLFPVGRLDYDSEGLIILTNDGGLTYKLTHPSNEIPKTYLVKVVGEVPQADLAKLRNGVELDGVKTKRAKIKLKDIKSDIYSFEITIYEGRNRQVRRMFETVDKDVIFLKRLSIGDVRLGGLSRGTTRYLNDKEIEILKKM